MTEPLTLETTIHFNRTRGQRKRAVPEPPPPPPTGHLPRLTRLMALAIKLGNLIEQGATNHAQLARLGQVTRARMSQILNLLHLAPDIQEAILTLPKVVRGRASLRLADLQPLCKIADWGRQRRMWEIIQHGPK